MGSTEFKEAVLGTVGIAAVASVLIVALSTLGSCGRSLDETSVIKTCLSAGNPVAQCMSMYDEEAKE
jgi:hypothetical protein